MQPESASVQPAPRPVESMKTKKFPRQRHFLAVFFISFMWGIVGADRMYLGKWGTGILKLVTIGGFGIWLVVDLFLIMNGSMRDAHGREMLEFDEYKSLARRVVLIFALAVGVIVVVTGIELLFVLSQLMNGLQDGSFQGIPGLEGLRPPGGLSPEQMTELGL